MSGLRLAALSTAAAGLLAVILLIPAGDALFSLHMTQHLLLIAIVAPLIVLAGYSIPISPLLGWLVFVPVFLFWHWPTAFGWAALHPLGAFVEFGSILAAAICFWSGALANGPANDGARALAVMTAAVVTDLPGVVMLFASHAICVMPHEDAARFGLTPLADQQLAGLLMWVPANLVFFGIATFLFARWIGLMPRQPA